MRMDADYKILHESLTSNNNGTTALESTAVVVPSILSLYIASGLRALLFPSAANGTDRFEYGPFFAEFLCVVMPCVLCFTVLADHLGWVLVVSLVACIATFCLSQIDFNGVCYNFCKRFQDRKTFEAVMAQQFNPRRRPYLTNFRAITNMLTVLCILAVDFHIFPRRFAKTETYGYGVMDLGVGLFIIANALVAPEVRDGKPVIVPLLETTIHCIPLIALGAGRVFFTSQVNYQEHVTEYGHHWNFFFTLTVTKLVCSGILQYVKHHTGVFMLLCTGLLISYEFLLECGLRTWILSDAPRLDFVSANREGLASNVGYIALYFGGVSLGKVLQKWETLNAVSNWTVIKNLIFTSFILWVITFACENTVGISRRLANVGYFFWLMSFTTTVLALLLIVEFLLLVLQFFSSGSKKYKPNPHITFVPNILEAVNMNGLVYFLIGNVLTGVINIAFKTFQLNALTSLLIVTFYMFVNFATVSFLFRKKVALKF